jgi:hypothetical protein
MFVFYFGYSVFFLFFVCIVYSFVYSCLFPIFVQVYRPMPPGENSIAVNKYHIYFWTSYIWNRKAYFDVWCRIYRLTYSHWTQWTHNRRSCCWMCLGASYLSLRKYFRLYSAWEVFNTWWLSQNPISVFRLTRVIEYEDPISQTLSAVYSYMSYVL